MKRGAYYNEIDPYAAAWLRNLIAAGHIAPGDVDERSIEDVEPAELRGYVQCHFFAGVGVWSSALRLAGWPDDRPVWTGSCPCQPFSAAGKAGGFDDERHLWPAWHWLISELQPAIVLGEQVASAHANPWIDLVSTDLEGLGYAFGALAFPSAGIGAPHIRDRTYFLAHANNARLEGWRGMRERAAQFVARPDRVVGELDDAGRVRLAPGWRAHAEHDGAIARATGEGGRLADSDDCGPQGRGAAGVGQEVGNALAEPAGSGAIGRLAYSDGDAGEQGRSIDGGRDTRGDAQSRSGSGGRVVSDVELAGPTNGFWRDADWLLCRDGKWRPVEPGSFPLVDGAPSRVGRLRAYGNAINRYAAAAFIESAIEAIDGMKPAPRALVVPATTTPAELDAFATAFRAAYSPAVGLVPVAEGQDVDEAVEAALEAV